MVDVSYHVTKDGRALVYSTERPNWYGTLAVDPRHYLGVPLGSIGHITAKPDELRPATLADFERFRVSPKGHLDPGQRC